LLSVIANYFLMPRPVYGGGKGVFYEVILLLGVIAGCIAQWVLDSLNTGSFPWVRLLAGVIASIVIFPTVWQRAGLKNTDNLSLSKWCVAFQNGYFWPVLMTQVSRTFH